MADQHRDYEDYRRGGRREWTERAERRAAELERRALVRQPAAPLEIAGDGDSYTDDGYTFRTGRIEWIRP